MTSGMMAIPAQSLMRLAGMLLSDSFIISETTRTASSTFLIWSSLPADWTAPARGPAKAGDKTKTRASGNAAHFPMFISPSFRDIV